MAFKSKSVKHGTNRFSVRGFLAAILHPFMASPTDAPGVFTTGTIDTQVTVDIWNTVLLCNDVSSQCQLERMIYGKCTTGVGHEFLLLHFRHPTQRHAVAILVLDRTIRTNTENNSGSSRSVGQAALASPSVSPTPAEDTISTVINNGSAIESYLTNRYGAHKYLCNLEFPASSRPTAIQVSVLLCVLRKHSPTYHLWQYQCYWYAHTVWEALKTLFPDCRETTQSEGRSRFWGQPIKKADSVEDVCDQYRAEWACIENVAEGRRKVKDEEVRQLRMESVAEGLAKGRAQCRSEIDEERRQREEADRQREEAERKAGEYEAEMNRMRARLAELERRAV